MKKILFLLLVLFPSVNLLAQGFFLEETKDVAGYYNSGAWENEVEGVIDEAMNYVTSLQKGGMTTAVFDVDETCLSNFTFYSENGFDPSDSASTAWVKSGMSPAIPPVKKLYDYFVSQNYKIVFLTGRSQAAYPFTYDNLVKQGFTTFDTLICKNTQIYTSTAAEYKSTVRKQLTGAGYNIVVNTGDQWSDLEGGNSGFMIRIPNYMYVIE